MMEKEATKHLGGLEIGALDLSVMEEALGVISRGMRDNPIHVAAFGEDARSAGGRASAGSSARRSR